MKKLVILLFSIFAVQASMASECYTSDVEVVFDNEGLNVEIPSLVCVKNLKATNVSRYSGEVTATLKVGTELVETKNRIMSIKYLPNGLAEITFTVLEATDDNGTCDAGVGFDIKIKALIDNKSNIVKVEDFYGYATSTPDNCHGPFYDTNLDYKPVQFINY